MALSAAVSTSRSLSPPAGLDTRRRWRSGRLWRRSGARMASMACSCNHGISCGAAGVSLRFGSALTTSSCSLLFPSTRRYHQVSLNKYLCSQLSPSRCRIPNEGSFKLSNLQYLTHSSAFGPMGGAGHPFRYTCSCLRDRRGYPPRSASPLAKSYDLSRQAPLNGPRNSRI